jgi:imidazolonepropionase-like amidohydrolase
MAEQAAGGRIDIRAIGRTGDFPSGAAAPTGAKHDSGKCGAPRGNIIERISASPITVDAIPNVRIIAVNGRVLMPGLIDAHWHAFMAATPQMLLMTADPSYLHLLAARQAEATLMRGFITIRDLGGPVFGLKRAIERR